MSKGTPYTPWYHGDFLRSTAGWTLTERAVYWMLLNAQWEIGHIPKEMSRLAAIAGITVEEITAVWKLVGPKFIESEDGLINPRMEEHRQNYLAYREKLSDGGSRGMKTRWHQEEPLHKEIIAAWHEILPKLPRVKGWPKSRAINMNARIAERVAAGKPANTAEYWSNVFEKIAASPFLCGQKGEWRASLPWLIESEENLTKVIEGQYDGRSGEDHRRFRTA